MQLIQSFANNLHKTYPQFLFVAESEFRWDPDTQSVFYDQSSSDTAALLHELAHGLLDHTVYHRDVELLELEQAAWRYAADPLAPDYNVIITDDQIEDSLDSYRDWLHARSTCPNCKATGFQIKPNLYKCIACFELWKVNDARACALRRYKIKTK
jgi:hypothetical protein